MDVPEFLASYRAAFEALDAGRLAGFFAYPVQVAGDAGDHVSLSPRLHQAVVRWRLVDTSGRPVYEFDACYTLVEVDGQLRIGAIAHDELPRLPEALSAAGGHEP